MSNGNRYFDFKEFYICILRKIYYSFITMSNFIINFWYGRISLWKSFWLVGLIHAISVTYFAPFFEKNFFNNDKIFNYIQLQNTNFPILNFKDLTLITKFLIIITTIYVTVGIWRSAEKYTGPIIIIIITLIYLSINNLLPLIFFILYLFN